MWKTTWMVGLIVAVVGCGGEGSTGGTGDAGGASGSGGVGASGGTGATSGAGGTTDAGDDAPPPADGPFACGTQTCGPTQYCIHPCCGGAPPACIEKPEGGSCPAGYHDGCSYGGCAGVSCCEMDPCTPPPPYCADVPQLHPSR